MRLLFQASYTDVLSFAQRRCHPSHAEDVVAETFAVAWRRIDEVPSHESDARAWLFGVARHCLLNNGRARNRQQALAVRLADEGLRGPQQAGVEDDSCLRMDLAAAWRQLDPGAQEVLALTVFEHLDSKQAAVVLGLTPTAYRLRLMRARRHLRRLLDHEDEERSMTAAVQEVPR